MSQQVPLNVEIEMSAWAYPPKNGTLWDLLKALRSAGNVILEIDNANERVLVGYAKG